MHRERAVPFFSYGGRRIYMQKWVVSAKRADFQKIAEEFHIDPVIARLIRNRDVVGEDAVREYLTAGLESLHR